MATSTSMTLRQWLQEYAYSKAAQDRFHLVLQKPGEKAVEARSIGRGIFNEITNKGNYQVTISVKGHLWWKRVFVVVNLPREK